MPDKDREQKAVNAVIKHIAYLTDFEDISGPDQERPDFIFRKDNVIEGVEHIEIPILPMSGQNAEHYFKDKAVNLYESFKDIYSSCYDKTIKAMENHVNENLEAYSEFSHKDFLVNSARLLGVGPQKKRKHNATQYIERLKKQFPDCEVKISFVLDIGYSLNDISHFQYKETPLDDFHTQRLLDFPFTYVFVILLMMIKDVYDIYIVWHPYDDYSGKYVRVYDIHLDEKHLLKKESYIPRLWWEFDMPENLKRAKVKLNLKYDE